MGFIAYNKKRPASSVPSGDVETHTFLIPDSHIIPINNNYETFHGKLLT